MAGPKAFDQTHKKEWGWDPIAEQWRPVQVDAAGRIVISNPGSGGGGSGGVLMVEEPSGAIDGVNDVFTTSLPYQFNSTTLFLNGLAQAVPDDYIEATSTTVQFVDAPLPGDTLRISYMEA